jgi:hypothetical protein
MEEPKSPENVSQSAHEFLEQLMVGQSHSQEKYNFVKFIKQGVNLDAFLNLDQKTILILSIDEALGKEKLSVLDSLAIASFINSCK